MDDHDDLLQRLRTLGARPVDPTRQAADLAAMATVRPRARIGSKLRIAAAFLAGLLLGSTGLAAADALPDPAQHVAHAVLGRVGVQVPDPDRYHGPECGAEVKRNHGAYVRDDHSQAQTDCGKKAKAAGANDDGDGSEPKDKAAKAAKDPCHGKPSWAGDDTLTAEQKAAAQAERAARCGTQVDAEAVDEADEADEAETTESGSTDTEEQDAPASTSTTDAPTTTVAAEPTTTTAT